jgi:hypothetical protein
LEDEVWTEQVAHLTVREGKAKLNGPWSWRRRRSGRRRRSYLLMGKPDILQLPVGLV